MSTKIWIYVSNYYFNILYALFVFSYRYCSQYYSVAILYIYVLYPCCSTLYIVRK